MCKASRASKCVISTCHHVCRMKGGERGPEAGKMPRSVCLATRKKPVIIAHETPSLDPGTPALSEPWTSPGVQAFYRSCESRCSASCCRRHPDRSNLDIGMRARASPITQGHVATGGLGSQDRHARAVQSHGERKLRCAQSADKIGVAHVLRCRSRRARCVESVRPPNLPLTASRFHVFAFIKGGL